MENARLHRSIEMINHVRDVKAILSTILKCEVQKAKKGEMNSKNIKTPNQCLNCPNSEMAPSKYNIDHSQDLNNTIFLSAMEYHWQKNFRILMGEERNSFTLPRRPSFGNNQSACDNDMKLVSARTSPASGMSIPLSSTSPETPWTLSPSSACPSRPLVYRCIASLHRYEGNILSIALSKDFIFVGSESRRVHAWKHPDCTGMGYISASSGQIRAILANGRMLFTAHGDCRIRMWDIKTGENFRPKKIMTFPPRNPFSFSKKSNKQHRDRVSCLAYNQADRLLYTGSWDRTIKVWNASERCCVDSFVAHQGQVNAIAVNQEDGCVFSCSSDGCIKIWRRVFGESSHILTMTLKFQSSPVNAMALMSLSPGSCFLYSGSSDGLINFWEKEIISGQYNHGGFLQGHHFAVLCLVSIGNLIFSGSEDSTIRIWRRHEESTFHSCLSIIEGHHGPVKCLAVFSETENMLKILVCSASLDQTFKVWRVKVFPRENLSLDLEGSDLKQEQRESVECEMNPVLSPSWVEKKLQGSF